MPPMVVYRVRGWFGAQEDPLFSESNSIDPCDERCIPLEDKEKHLR